MFQRHTEADSLSIILALRKSYQKCQFRDETLNSAVNQTTCRCFTPISTFNYTAIPLLIVLPLFDQIIRAVYTHSTAESTALMHDRVTLNG